MTSYVTRGLLAAMVTFAIAAPTARAEVNGTWMLQRDGDKFSLQLSQRPSQNFGIRIAVSALAQTDTGLRFRRAAGDFLLTGDFDGQAGGGTFVFQANAAYRAALTKRGLGPVDERKQLQLAALDITIEAIDGLRALGYDERLSRYIEMGIHGVTPAYVKALKEVGYADLSARRLIDMRIHGVTPEYVQGLQRADLKPSARQLIDMRIHGVSVEFVSKMRGRTSSSLAIRDLLEFRIHGVAGEFIEALEKLGYAHVKAQQLVEMRIHGARPEWIRGIVEKLGRKPSIRQLVEFRIHGVNTELIETLTDLGYEDFSGRDLVDLRIHGARPDWIRSMVKKASERPSIRRLIDHRIHGRNELAGDW